MAPSTAVRRGAVLLLVALAVVLLLVLLEGCGSREPAPGPSMSPSPTPGPIVTPPPTTTANVYYLVDTRLGFRLARERRTLPATETLKAAVEAMIAGPQDPDYTTPWNPRTRVLAIRRTGTGVVQVELSDDARRANAGSEVAARMVQQLVYTVTELAGRGMAVQLLIDGRPAGELWGALAWDRPIRRAPAADVRTLVQIDSPTEGQLLTSTVRVSGEAAAYEANVPWRIRDESGRVVREGFTLTSEGQRFAPYSFTVRLPLGSYTVEVTEDDPSDGAAGTPMTDSRRFLVGPPRR